MEKTTVETRTLENWFKLSFRLIVGDYWQEVAPLIAGGDTTYRWCREMILNALRKLETSADKFLSPGISSVKDELWKLRSIYVENARFTRSKILTWENTFNMAFDLTRHLADVTDKLTALKLAIIAKAFTVGDKNDASSLKRKLFPVFLTLKDVSRDQTAYKDVIEAFYIFAEFLGGYDISTDEEKTRMGERPKEETTRSWQPPDSWCFGDFGDGDGQLEYPVDVLVNKQGEFLVLEENSKGKDTIQRLQRFDRRGRHIKTILQRGLAGITAMSDMALDIEGNVVVSLKDENGTGRVNVYNMQGDCVRVVEVLIPDPNFPPFFTCVAVDGDGRILVVEHNEMSVQVYGKDGKFLFKFGKAGRSGDDGVFDNIYSISSSQLNEIYICDPYQRVQVFNSEGKFLRSFKPAGIVPSNVIVMESDRLVYGINRDAQTLEVYSLDATKVIRKVGGHGDQLGKLWCPMGIAMIPDGRIAVAEKESHRIQLMKI